MARTVAQGLVVALRADSSWTRPHDSVFADPLTGRPVARTPMMRRYRAALAAAELDRGFRFHDLRHTFGTSMASAGEPVTTIHAWLGHGDLNTTQRYMHYAPAADQAERVEREFAIDESCPSDIAARPGCQRMRGAGRVDGATLSAAGLAGACYFSVARPRSSSARHPVSSPDVFTPAVPVGIRHDGVAGI